LPLEGVRSYRRQLVAYRNDFCISCNAPRLAHQVRSFKIYHLYYIPIVPLGFWREWECSECGRDPHAYPGTPRNLRWMMVLFAAFFAITGVIASFDGQDSAMTKWLMRLGLPALFFIVLWFAFRNKPDRALREKLRALNADHNDTCALCSGTLVLDQGWRCSQCSVAREEVLST